MLITIPVAVYNGEKYLVRCLDSVLGQSSEDWRLICVDDCSTDNSINILQDYAEKDARIKIIRKEKNEGGPKARMTAYREAQTEYVFTGLDQDDYVEKDFVAKLGEEARHSNADIILCDWMLEKSDGEFKSFHEAHGRGAGERITGSDAFAATFPSWSIHLIGLWSRHLVDRFAIREEYAFNNYNADEFLSRIIAFNAQNIYFGSAKYFHCRNTESVTTKPSTRKILALQTDEELLSYAIKQGCERKIIKAILLSERKDLARVFKMFPHVRFSTQGTKTKTTLIKKIKAHFDVFKKNMRREYTSEFSDVFDREIILAILTMRYIKMRIKILKNGLNQS